ncbi:MAG: hypothetical protein ACE5EX_05835 [Phycisphaerae bacterium]
MTPELITLVLRRRTDAVDRLVGDGPWGMMVVRWMASHVRPGAAAE